MILSISENDPTFVAIIILVIVVLWGVLRMLKEKKR